MHKNNTSMHTISIITHAHMTTIIFKIAHIHIMYNIVFICKYFKVCKSRIINYIDYYSITFIILIYYISFRLGMLQFSLPLRILSAKFIIFLTFTFTTCFNLSCYSSLHIFSFEIFLPFYLLTKES